MYLNHVYTFMNSNEPIEYLLNSFNLHNGQQAFSKSHPAHRLRVCVGWLSDLEGESNT